MRRTIRFVLDGRTTRAKLWRLAYSLDYSLGTKRLLGNRRPAGQPAAHAWHQRGIAAVRTEDGVAKLEDDLLSTGVWGKWVWDEVDGQTDRQTDSHTD